MYFLSFVIIGRTPKAADAVGRMLNPLQHSWWWQPLPHRSKPILRVVLASVFVWFAGLRSGLLLTKRKESPSVRQYHLGPGGARHCSSNWETAEPSADPRFPSVMVRVLQRNRTNRSVYCTCRGKLTLRTWLT